MKSLRDVIEEILNYDPDDDRDYMIDAILTEIHKRLPEKETYKHALGDLADLKDPDVVDIQHVNSYNQAITDTETSLFGDDK
jgi:hypothetical protein